MLPIIGYVWSSVHLFVLVVFFLTGFGIPAPVTAGAVLSGAYFGDKLSPLSDSCVLSAAMSDIDVIDHVRGILPVSLSAFGITGIAFTVLGFRLGGGSADMTQVNSVGASGHDPEP